MLLTLASTAAAAPELPAGASPSASPPEFNVNAEDQRSILRWPEQPGPPTDDLSWIGFEAYGVSTGRFVVLGARDDTRLPNGRLANGRVLCELAPDSENDATPHAWACRTRIGLGPMNGRGMWWTQVAYADCLVDGARCGSTSTVRYRLTGVMAPTRPVLPRRRVKVAASHLESSPAAAGGLGFPAVARVPVRCAELSSDRKPGTFAEQTDDCQNVRVTLRTAGRINIDGRARRWLLGRGSTGILVNRVKRVAVSLDAGRVNVAHALTIERLL